jgi:hypothetical protein
MGKPEEELRGKRDIGIWHEDWQRRHWHRFRRTYAPTRGNMNGRTKWSAAPEYQGKGPNPTNSSD